jgi:glycosyltransferase involved in cell wall biosynthesis
VRVAFLTQDLQLSGGVGVIVTHASQLARHGFDVDLVLTRDRPRPDWSHHGLSAVQVIGFEQARTRSYDVALATWWETAQQLFDLDAARHACFVQSLEDRFYGEQEPQRMVAALAQDLPVRFITEARWIADTLEALHPGEKAFYVRNGIAKDLFSPVPEVPVRRAEPLRILVEGSLGVPFKGVGDALAAVGAMTAPRHLTLVAPDSPGTPIAGVDRMLGAVPQRRLAELYAATDVVLKLSRVEGMSGPPLEGFHMGATCVVTPVTGHEEYVVHGENGLVVDWDDTAGTARALDLLARDGVLLHRLRSGALATARAWPGWEQQGQVMAAVLRAVRREPPPDPRRSGRRLGHDMATALSDGEKLATDLRVARLTASKVQSSRAYRAAVKGRSTIERIIRAPGRRRRRRRGEE